MAQVYRCLSGFEWNGHAYVKGLQYTAYDTPAHKAFAEMAEKEVWRGRFERIHSGQVGKACVAGRATVGE